MNFEKRDSGELSPQSWQRVKALYSAAAGLPVSERELFIERQAGADKRVFNGVLRLLRSESDAETRLAPLRVPQGLLTTRRGALLDGQLLAERYRIRRFIASGGFGEVYEAEDLERGEAIAVKLIRAEYATSAHVPWLRREVQLARRIQHPNVCRVFDLVQATGAVFLTMELLSGETLAQFLKREGSLSERRAMPIIRQIVAALAAAHQSGVVHRDLKPSNIMIVPRPDGPDRAVVTDFGMARQSQQDRGSTVSVQQTTLAFGTPGYMAPEQITGATVGPSADIYSFGVVLHEMLTGELPFADPSPLTLAVQKTKSLPPPPTRFAPALRDTWVQAIQRCLEPNPDRRFRSVVHVLEFLQSRSRTAVYSRLAKRRVRRLASTRTWRAASLVFLLAAGFLIWRNAFAPPSPEARRALERSLFSLHSNQPAEAIRQFEAARAQYNLPSRVGADLALAWNQLGMKQRGVSELPVLARFLAPETDRSYVNAIRNFLAGDKDVALQLLKQRTLRAPADAEALADLAYLESLVQGKPSRLWHQVSTLRPDHPAAHLAFARALAQDGQIVEAEREFLTAETYALSHEIPTLAKAVAGSRGLARLAAGELSSARTDLLPFFSEPQATAPGAGPCERVITLVSGIDDNFQAPPEEVAYRSERFGPDRLQTRLALFDQPNVDRGLLISFPLPPVRICSGRLQFRMRRDPEDGGTLNDAIVIGAAPFRQSEYPALQRSMWADFPGISETVMTMDVQPETFANVQRVYAGQAVASLDIVAGEDTEFDYFKLVIVY